ncbi:MAG: DUF58 domain-containing protein [Flavobacteriales bacterium]|nr:DUF58 domain-containing protein [Flavobacteriales bacterium]
MIGISNILLTKRFFWVLSTFVVLYATAFIDPRMLAVAEYAFIALAVLVGLDLVLLLLISKKPTFKRTFNERLNLGDENSVTIQMTTVGAFPWNYELNEGFPDFKQDRVTTFKGKISFKEPVSIKYQLQPKKRGLFHFNDAFLFLSTFLKLVERRIVYPNLDAFQVYPSVLQMKKYELLVFQQQKTGSGIKRIRRLGNATEFEQIRNYVAGDELKTINWKATSRKNELMVNQYQDEKSQSVYCIIDKSRTMQMEFDGLNILDYSINSTLVFANICLLKGDKFGMLTFSDKMGAQIPADKSGTQMKRVMDTLYAQKTKFKDANFEQLQSVVRQKIKTRSLLLLFSNFENEFAMRRALPYLMQMNKKHLLVVIFFQNSDLKELAYKPHYSLNELYTSVVAERMITMKARMAREMKQFGIQTILTNPEELSANVINKYLELKARGSF